MKKFALMAISFYQVVFSPLIKQLLGLSSQCRYSPTCSEYAKRSIENHGVFKGSRLAVVRIISCQPFTKISNIEFK